MDTDCFLFIQHKEEKSFVKIYGFFHHSLLNVSKEKVKVTRAPPFSETEWNQPSSTVSPPRVGPFSYSVDTHTETHTHTFLT